MKKIDFEDNLLTTIPASFNCLSNLSVLCLQKNLLEDVPECLFTSLLLLVELMLSNNKLKVIPESIGGLTNLTDLKLDNNKLESLPNSIGFLTNLTSLSISNNSITVYPDTIQDLKKLKKLDLDEKELELIPQTIRISCQNS